MEHLFFLTNVISSNKSRNKKFVVKNDRDRWIWIVRVRRDILTIRRIVHICGDLACQATQKYITIFESFEDHENGS